MELSLSEFVVYVLAGAFALTGFFIFISRLSRRGAGCRGLRHRVICRLCLHAYEDHGSARTPECPQCGALNERGRDRRLG
jgi:hypothetical protein